MCVDFIEHALNNLTHMKKTVAILFLLLIANLSVWAQGSVTVTQSADIDALVNGKNNKANNKDQSKKNKRTEQNKPSNTQTPKKQDLSRAIKLPTATPVVPRTEIKIAAPKPAASSTRTRTVAVVRRRVRHNKGGKRTVMKQKILTGAHKAKGFRIQLYSGGNTRKDREQAEQIGLKAKAVANDQPVYVHFYAPRWMCYMGNFVEYKDAQVILRKLKSNGFDGANIVRTMITVRDASYRDIDDNYMDY